MKKKICDIKKKFEFNSKSEVLPMLMSPFNQVK